MLTDRNLDNRCLLATLDSEKLLFASTGEYEEALTQKTESHRKHNDETAFALNVCKQELTRLQEYTRDVK